MKISSPYDTFPFTIAPLPLEKVGPKNSNNMQSKIFTRAAFSHRFFCCIQELLPERVEAGYAAGQKLQQAPKTIWRVPILQVFLHYFAFDGRLVFLLLVLTFFSSIETTQFYFQATHFQPSSPSFFEAIMLGRQQHPVDVTPLTPRRRPSMSSCSGDTSSLVISPDSVRMISSRRCTLQEMHQSLCMLDQSTTSVDCPPMLPSRNDSMHSESDCYQDIISANDENREHQHHCSLSSMIVTAPTRDRSNSRDNSIVNLLLPNSPNKTRASFSFSNSVSELPRAGASIRRRSSPTIIDTSNSKNNSIESASSSSFGRTLPNGMKSHLHSSKSG